MTILNSEPYIDGEILSAWNELISKGVECSLFLRHRKGNVSTVLKSNKKIFSEAIEPLHDAASRQDRKGKNKRKKGGKKNLEGLLSYHQYLVEKKGLPPSRLMLEQAALASPTSSSTQTSTPVQVHEDKQFSCQLCDFLGNSNSGLEIHLSRKHKKVPQLDGMEEIEESEKDKCPNGATDKPEADNVDGMDMDHVDGMEDIEEEDDEDESWKVVRTRRKSREEFKTWCQERKVIDQIEDGEEYLQKMWELRNNVRQMDSYKTTRELVDEWRNWELRQRNRHRDFGHDLHYNRHYGGRIFEPYYDDFFWKKDGKVVKVGGKLYSI